MRIWTIVLVLVVAIVAAFAVANWAALAAPTSINLVLAEVTAPLGLTMLGAVLGLTLLFLLFVVWLETKALVGIGRAGRQSHETAGLPIGELRGELNREFSGFRTETSESMRTVIARLDTLERVVKDELERTNQALTSSLRHNS